MNERSFDFSDLRLRLQVIHSILGVAWPRPGYASLAGSGAFIKTNVFTALQKVTAELDLTFENLNAVDDRTGLVIVWQRCSELIRGLQKLDPKKKELAPAIDSALNLVFFATGVLHQEVSSRYAGNQPQDARFATVRSIEDLKNVCKWTSKEQPLSILPRVLEESLRALDGKGVSS